MLTQPGKSERGDGIGGEDVYEVFDEFGVLGVSHPVHDLRSHPTGGEDGGAAGEDEGIGCRGEDFGGLLGLFGEVEEGGFKSECEDDSQETCVGKHDAHHAVFGWGEFDQIQGYEQIIDQPTHHGAESVDGGLRGQFFENAHGANIGSLGGGWLRGLLPEVVETVGSSRGRADPN